MKRTKIYCAVLVSYMASMTAFAGNNYPYKDHCPSMGIVLPGDYFNKVYKDGVYREDLSYWVDIYGFAQCNCTSYVAYKLNAILEQHSPTHPMFDNGFHNMGPFRWGNAYHWRDAIGVAVPGFFSRYPEVLSTNESAYPWKMMKDGVTYDARMAVAWWDKDKDDPKSVGHVGWLESVAADGKTVTVSEYNWPSASNGNRPLRYGTRTLAPGQADYPSGFLYIVTDSFLECDLTGLCDVSASGKSGQGGGPTQVNLEESFRVTQIDGRLIFPGDATLIPGQTVLLKVQIKALDDDAERWAQPGKEKIETDYWVRIGNGDWERKNREYTKIKNLKEGETHTETFAYVVPYTGGQSMSFKVKIDAEDEVHESNEHDNTSRIDAFPVANVPAPKPDFITQSFRFLQTPVYAGDQAKFAGSIYNIGPVTPPFGIRSSYEVECPGMGRVFLTDDGTNSYELTPGREIQEATKAPVTMPNVSGTCVAYFCADARGWVDESNEMNNCSSLSFPLVTRPAPGLTITRFEDKVGCCTTNTGAAPKPRLWIRNTGSVAPGANVMVTYQVSSPVATGGLYHTIGYGTIEPRELPPGDTDEDHMDCDGCWRIPKDKAWKKQWHTFRACLRTDGASPTPSASTPSPGEVCATYSRYSKE